MTRAPLTTRCIARAEAGLSMSRHIEQEPAYRMCFPKPGGKRGSGHYAWLLERLAKRKVAAEFGEQLRGSLRLLGQDGGK